MAPLAIGADDSALWDSRIKDAEKQSERDRQNHDKFVRRFKDGHFGPQKDGEVKRGVNVNLSFAYATMVMAMFAAQPPAVEVTPEEGGYDDEFAQVAQFFGSVEAAKEEFAKGLEKCLGHSYRLGKTQLANTVTIFNSTLRGQGWTKESFDPKRGLNRVDALRRDEVFVDPNARYDLGQAQHIIQTCVLPIDLARAFFAEKGVTKGIEPNHCLVDEKGMIGEQARLAEKSSNTKDLFKFYELWRKDGDYRGLDYRAFQKTEWLHRGDWPFLLDNDDFPYTHLQFNTQFSSFNDAFSEEAVVEGLRETYNEFMEFMRRHTKRAAATKVLYDKSRIGEDEAKKLASAKDLEFVGCDEPGPGGLQSLIQMVDLNTNFANQKEIPLVAKAAADEVIGMDELQRGATQRKLTATQADIIDEFGKARHGRRQTLVDEALANQAKHGAQILRQLGDPEKMRKIAGQQFVQLMQMYGGNADDLVCQYSIGITAGSTSERHKRERIANLKDMIQIGLQVNQSTDPFAEKVDLLSLAKEVFRKLGERRPDRWILPANPPPPQVAAGPAGPGGPAAAAEGQPQPAPGQAVSA